MSEHELPFEAVFEEAPKRRFAETIVFVHHFGGSKRTVLRHVRLAHALGFNTVRFDLVFNQLDATRVFPITADLRIGARHLWTNQIESILNAIPGKKILYTFSMPSLGALGAIANRRASDITAWICDGGPFLQLIRSTWNLFEHEYKVESKTLRALYTGLSYFIFGYGVERSVSKWLDALPQGFPVLSIRGEKDPLVPPAAIDEVFSQTTKLDLHKLSLPEGHHLDGLKRFGSVYEKTVTDFLTPISTPFTAPAAQR